MFRFLRHRLWPAAQRAIRVVARAFSRWCTPLPASPLVGTLADLARSRPALIAENALLRHQLAILHRSVKRPRCTPADRALLVLLAGRVRAWRSALCRLVY